MKKLMKLGSLVAFLFVIGLAFSSFTASSEVTTLENNGVDVEVIKGGDYWIIACGELIYRDKNTQQYKDGVLHMRTTVYRLPEGNCAIPDKAKKVRPWPGYTLNYSPSGVVVVKEVYN